MVGERDDLQEGDHKKCERSQKLDPGSDLEDPPRDLSCWWHFPGIYRENIKVLFSLTKSIMFPTEMDTEILLVHSLGIKPAENGSHNHFWT